MYIDKYIVGLGLTVQTPARCAEDRVTTRFSKISKDIGDSGKTTTFGTSRYGLALAAYLIESIMRCRTCLAPKIRTRSSRSLVGVPSIIVAGTASLDGGPAGRPMARVFGANSFLIIAPLSSRLLWRIGWVAAQPAPPVGEREMKATVSVRTPWAGWIRTLSISPVPDGPV